MTNIPKLVSVELVSSGWINKYLLTYEMPDGTIHPYESISRKGLEAYREILLKNAEGQVAPPDAVSIVPLLPDRSLLMVKEFRYPLNSWCIAFPAGLLDPGETIYQCVARELHEETGYRIRTDLGDDAVYALRQTGYSSAGLAEENVQIVFAEVEPGGSSEPEPNELIETFLLPHDQINRFLDTNTIPMGTRAQLILEMLGRIPRFEIGKPPVTD